jgi:hypothetical protein
LVLHERRTKTKVFWIKYHFQKQLLTCIKFRDFLHHEYDASWPL